MERVTIGKLRNQLSAYLRKVKAGETVLVMDRNTVVARIEPARAAESDKERLARLEAKGIIRRPKEPWNPDHVIAMLKNDPPKSTKSAVEALLEEREEGW